MIGRSCIGLGIAVFIGGCATEVRSDSQPPSSSLRGNDGYVTGSRLVRRNTPQPEVQVWEIRETDRIQIAPVWIRPPGN
jgi:hypothetical protein